MPPWVLMWLLAFWIFGVCKWSTYREARREGFRASRVRAIGYLIAWPGMDARTFLNAEKKPPKPVLSEWLMAFLKTALGGTLFWGIARLIPAQHLLLRGWVGMIGIIFLLHFGSFHIMALLWQRKGVAAFPIMRAPVRAVSLGDFWGNRWNLGFRQLTYQWVFQPSRGRVGPAWATLFAFLVSGVVHEAVISLPAGAGYGLPTGYFLVQGMGVVVERSVLGERLGLGRGKAGWFFTFLFTVGPAFWLFHPPFVERVIVPFMRAAAAL